MFALKKEVGNEGGMVLGAPQRERTHTGHLSWVFYLFLGGGNLSRGLGRASVKYSPVSQVCSLRVMVTADWSVTGQGIFGHYSWSWHRPPGFAAFLGLELNYNGSLDVISREERPGEKRLPWGWGPCFPSFAPCQALLVTVFPGCELLGVVFSYLSQSLYSTCQETFLAPQYCLSISSCVGGSAGGWWIWGRCVNSSGIVSSQRYNVCVSSVFILIGWFYLWGHCCVLLSRGMAPSWWGSETPVPGCDAGELCSYILIG